MVSPSKHCNPYRACASVLITLKQTLQIVAGTCCLVAVQQKQYCSNAVWCHTIAAMSHVQMCSPDVHCLRYKPFLVAEVKLNDPKQPEGGNIDPAESDKASAFKQLAGFLGKKNDRGQGLSMTTPVFNKSKQGIMQFYIGEGYKVRPADAKNCCI